MPEYNLYVLDDEWSARAGALAEYIGGDGEVEFKTIHIVDEADPPAWLRDAPATVHTIDVRDRPAWLTGAPLLVETDSLRVFAGEDCFRALITLLPTRPPRPTRPTRPPAADGRPSWLGGTTAPGPAPVPAPVPARTAAKTAEELQTGIALPEFRPPGPDATGSGAPVGGPAAPARANVGMAALPPPDVGMTALPPPDVGMAAAPARALPPPDVGATMAVQAPVQAPAAVTAT